MIVKSQLKLIRSLHQKKYRNQHQLFIAEGIKVVNELLDSDFRPYQLYTTDPRILATSEEAFETISEGELKQMSTLTTPNTVLGVFHMPKAEKVDFSDWVLVLDAVRDPGNLGTIIRLCDWFGIRHLVCSATTVDCYNPKVLQATMGSIARVNLVYTDIIVFLKEVSRPVYGAFMNGSSVYSEKLPKAGILVMGNEANGISEEIEKLTSKKIAIPQFGKKTAESLNVASATSILLNEIRR
ncbi:MAG: TrmH family RNA methyltransferase [Flavobacteriaceae bacterium]